MVLFWPGLLGLLVSIPLLAVAYWWVQQRRRRITLRYSSLSLLRPALQKPSRVRRHLPAALFLLALTSLVIALARPATVNLVPGSYTTVILAMDVSGSMSSSDIYPNRLEAAKSAALSFVQSQKSTTQIGLVAFSSIAQPIQIPTKNEAQLEASVRSLTFGDSTAIGDGIIQSLIVIDQLRRKNPRAAEEAKSKSPQIPVTGKAYAPEIIVLLTDGMNNSGPNPEDAAQQAVDKGVRVFTIGYGPETPPTNPYQDPKSSNRNRSSDLWNQGSFHSFVLDYDSQTLKSIAKMTGGKYYTASNASQLVKVFASLPIQKKVETETNEISVAFVAAGGLLAMIAIALSLLWHPIP
jgi:Ca-activated chloride channel homolog